MISWIAIFALFVVLDFVWARYTIAMAECRSLESANWAFLITFMSALAAIMYVGDNWLVIPAAAGGWLGTLVGVELKRRQRQGQKIE